MSLNHLEIAEVLEELREPLAGAQMQKIQEPAEDLLLLRVRNPGLTASLLISLEQQSSRFHVTEEKFTSPPSPPAFCMLLRKELMGRRLSFLEQLPEDRVIQIGFFARKEENDGRTLILELFGRSGNVFLLDGDGKILAAMKPASMKIRNLQVGSLYSHPELPPSGKTFAVRPFEEFQGDYNRRVDQFYAGQSTESELDSWKRKLLQGIRREKKRRKKLLAKLETERVQCLRHEEFQQQAQWIKASLHTLPKQAKIIDVMDFEGNQVSVELDPKVSVVENADCFFKKSRKLRRGLEYLEETNRKTGEELAGFQKAEALIESVEDMSGSGPVETFCHGLGIIPAVKPTKKRKGPVTREESGPRRFTTLDGREIIVGRNDQENDRVTFRMARGNDLFFHVRGIPGSHVILRMESKGTLTQDSLLDAAHLALFYSKARKARKGEVIYTSCKYVRKPKGAPPGKIHASQEKSIYVKIEEKRIQRLFGEEARGNRS